MNILLLCTTLLLVTACTEPQNSDPNKSKKEPQKVDLPAGWATISEEAYEMNYPADWHPDKSGQMGTKFILFSPNDSEQDDFKENFTLMMEDLPGKSINLEAYSISATKQIEQFITDAHILTSETIESNGHSAHKLIYTGTQGTLDLHFLQYFFVKDKKAYVLTFTAKQDSYARYETLATKMMHNFVLKD